MDRQLIKNRQLVMEDCGFDPKSMFSDEQISNMRNMIPEGNIKYTRKEMYVKIADRNCERIIL